jgi:hypothetical protein
MPYQWSYWGSVAEKEAEEAQDALFRRDLAIVLLLCATLVTAFFAFGMM